MTATKHISGIDHAVIATRNLDQAELLYRRLGFSPTPRGRHQRLGSINNCLMFPSGNYLELLGLASPDAPRPYYREFLRQREGLAAIALQTADVETAQQALAAAGLEPTAVVRFGRPVEMPDGTHEARFATVDVGSARTPAGRVFLCQHFTRELVWRRDYLAHRNGATELLSVGVVAAEPDAAAEVYTRIFGATPIAEPDGIRLQCGTSAMRFLTPAAFAERHPNEPLRLVHPPFMAIVTIGVADRERAAELLRNNAVPHRRKADGTIIVGSEAAVGTVLEFA